MAATENLRPIGRRTRVGIAAGTALGVLAAGAFWVTHPAKPPASTSPISAQTAVGTPVYLSLGGVDAGIDIAGVRAEVEASVDDTAVKILLCRDGTFEATTDPDLFCASLEDPSGRRMDVGDTLVAEVQGTIPGGVYLHQVRVSYTDGLQRGTADFGRPAVVTLLQR